MRLLAADLETTGKDTSTARIWQKEAGQTG